MNALQELILKTVSERYPSDASFYKQHGFNSGRWADFKAGRTDIDSMKYGRVERMKRVLFTNFEMKLLHDAEFNRMTGKAKDTLDEYYRLKLEAVKAMGEHMEAYVHSTLYDGSMSNNMLHIRHDEHKAIEVYVRNIGAPAGKKSRREYILANLDRLN